jgi:hypothetical protein
VSLTALSFAIIIEIDPTAEALMAVIDTQARSYPTDRTAALNVDPFNDFLSIGGKLWSMLAELGNAVGLHANPGAAAAAVRRARIPRSTLLLVAVIAAACPLPAVAEAQLDTPACKRNLMLASTGVNDVTERLRSGAKAIDDERCATYRQHLLVVVQARAVFAVCRNGPDRDVDIGRLDTTVEDINGAIAASCVVQ